MDVQNVTVWRKMFGSIATFLSFYWALLYFYNGLPTLGLLCLMLGLLSLRVNKFVYATSQVESTSTRQEKPKKELPDRKEDDQ